MHGIDSQDHIEDATCVVFEGAAKQYGQMVALPLWGRGDLLFECDVPIHVKSVLKSSIKHYGVPEINHHIFIDTPDKVLLTIYDGKQFAIIQMKMRTTEVSGRVKALRDRIGYASANTKTIAILKNLGEALATKFDILNTEKLTSIIKVDSDCVDIEMRCQCCGKQAVLKYSKKDINQTEKECEYCGWVGFLDIYDGRGSMVSVPKTTSVRNMLTTLHIKDDEDIYEQMFSAGLKPDVAIRKLSRMARQDYRGARRA